MMYGLVPVLPLWGGVTIHNGAVVAANSTVTRDVPPYAIVAGNPARVIKYRCSEATIQKLNQICWWNWSPAQLAERSSCFELPFEEFADRFWGKNILHSDMYDELTAKLADIEPRYFEIKNRYLFMCDYASPFPVSTSIIHEYVNEIEHFSSVLVVFINKDKYYDENLTALLNVLQQYEASDCRIILFEGNIKEAEGLLELADCYITSRHQYNIYMVEAAFQKSTRYISGFSRPIF